MPAPPSAARFALRDCRSGVRDGDPPRSAADIFVHPSYGPIRAESFRAASAGDVRGHLR